jgi:predicted phosphodiesterase
MIQRMRILVLSDIHANLVALETVLSDAAGKFDVIWCLGDVVGYGPKPNECIEIIRERADVCVMGNHDWAALDRPGINVDDFNPQARHAVLWTQSQLTPTARDYLNGLPDQPMTPVAGQSLMLTHASPREPVWEYILTPTIALENFLVFKQEICLVGHTHKPAVFEWRLESGEVTSDVAQPQNGHSVVTVRYLQPQVGSATRLDTSPEHRLILNPGSVGQPRDNDARAGYAILDLEKRTWLHERIAYPIELTQSQMRNAELPRRLIDRLSFGW